MTQVLPKGWSRVQTSSGASISNRGWQWHVSTSGLPREVARGIYGDSEEHYAQAVRWEASSEQHLYRHVFINKLRSRRRSGGLYPPEAERRSRLITLDEFSNMYSAAEFAADFGMPLDTMVTVAWSLLGFREPDEVQAAFGAFIKCAAEWLRERRLPVAYIYSHEFGADLGLHTHLALYVPAPDAGTPPTSGTSTRQEFRKWVMGYPHRNLGRRAPKALRVTFPRCESHNLHWHRFSYLVKGAAINELVMRAQNAPGGRKVHLGDLIAVPWCDPGPVRMRKRVGASQSVGEKQRKIGVPTGFEYLLARHELSPNFTIEPSNVKRSAAWFRPTHLARGPFRSKFEDGIRDVRRLYPREFWEPIIGPDPSPAPQTRPSFGEGLHDLEC